nr:hypothetical protein [Providencia rettgeri]
MSFITMMGKHPIHSTLVIFLKFRYPKQSVSCYSLFASTISIQRTNTTAPPPLLLLTPAISPSLAANILFNKWVVTDYFGSSGIIHHRDGQTSNPQYLFDFIKIPLP